MDCGDDVEAELETFSPVSVFVCDDAKSLQFSDDIFDEYACFTQQQVVIFVFLCEWVMLAFLFWQHRIFDVFLYALIAGIDQQPAVFWQGNGGFHKEFEVMRLAFRAGGADDCVCL